MSVVILDGTGQSGGAVAVDSEPCRAQYLRLPLLNHQRHYCPEQRARITRPVHIDESVVI